MVKKIVMQWGGGGGVPVGERMFIPTKNALRTLHTRSLCRPVVKSLLL